MILRYYDIKMITAILAWFASLIISVISSSGYLGVAAFMTLESACIPIPSEIIMPFSGFLASSGRFSLWLIVMAGTLGNVFGSLIAYFVGFYGGRAFIMEYGKYVFLKEEELEHADTWFKKYGSPAIFFSRLMPIVRTFISLPAGIGRMDLKKFTAYTFFGSLPWNFGLAYLGLKLGESWKNLEQYFRRFDYVILAIIAIGIAWWVKNHLLKKEDPA